MGSSTNQRASSKRSFAPFILLFLLLVMIAGAVFVLTRPTEQALPAEQAVVRTTNDSSAQQVVAPAPAQADANDRLLVWSGVGAAAGQHSAATPGQIVFMDGTGVSTPVMDVPAQTSRVMACGNEASSPDGQFYAFYMGLDEGKLYMMRSAEAPQAIADVQALSCVGNGTFQFSPNSARYAYIGFEPGSSTDEFADGFLHVASTASFSDEFSAENVTAFDITNDGVAFISFFTNDKNEADEAAITWWNGSAEREVATLNPNAEDCKFTSASIAVLPDGKFLSILGHRCTSGDTRTSWQLYVIDPETRSATLSASDFQAGQFATFARTNSIYLSPDGSRAMFTVPDGVTASTVGIKAVNLADFSISNPIERQAIMPNLNPGPQAAPRLSPDGRWLALVVTSPNNDNTLTVLNLADPAAAPISLSAGSTGDIIQDMAFTPDNSRLVFISGGAGPANNSLVALNLADGTDFRISRGRFGTGLAVSPTSAEVAVIDWQVLEDPQEPPFQKFVAININSSEVVTLFTGAEVVDGKVTNQNFAYPLAWRRLSG